MLQLLMATPRSRNLFALGTAVAALVIFGVVIRLVFTSVGASVPPEGRVAVLESRLRELEGEVARLRRQVGDFTSDATPVRASAKKTLLPTAPVSTTGLASVGSASATVAVIEYTDFQCPYCRQYFIETWPELYRQHISTGQIRYLFSHLPIASIHSQARAAAEAAECGHRQGKFWELRSLLFQNPKALTRDDLTRHAKKVSLNIPLFESCLAKEGPTAVEAAGKVAASMAIGSTPTFLIGKVQDDGTVLVTRRLSGAQPLPVFKGLIDELLSARQD